jgi:beta-glucosidase
MMTFLRFEITNAQSAKIPRSAFVEKADAVSAMTKKHLATLLCLLAFGFVPALAQQSRYPFNDPTLPMAKRIDNLLSLMTIDEKINCLSTNTGVPRLGVMNYGSSEGIH